MAYTSLGTKTWGSSPYIDLEFFYDSQRSSKAMQYKIKININKLRSSESYYEYYIKANIHLDGGSQVSAVQLKGYDISTWTNTITYESGWLTVPNKTSGTTSLKIDLLTDGERSNVSYSYTLPIISYTQPLAVSGPSNWSGKSGATASFSVGVSGGKTPYTYQWYLNSAKVGDNASDYSKSVSTSDNNSTVYCVITDNSGSTITSRKATITVAAITISVGSIAKNWSGYEGDSFSFTANPSGGSSYTYQWYMNGEKASTSKTYTRAVTYSDNEAKVYCVVTDTSGAKATTNTAVLHVGLTSSKVKISLPIIDFVQIANVQHIAWIYDEQWKIYRWNFTVNTSTEAVADTAIAGYAIAQ